MPTVSLFEKKLHSKVAQSRRGFPLLSCPQGNITYYHDDYPVYEKCFSAYFILKETRCVCYMVSYVCLQSMPIKCKINVQ